MNASNNKWAKLKEKNEERTTQKSYKKQKFKLN